MKKVFKEAVKHLNLDWDDVIDWLTVTDEERVEDALKRSERGILDTQQAFQWMTEQGWAVSANQNGPAALRQASTRDAAVFSLIQNFYNNDDDAAQILAAFEGQGFHNGTTTKTYLLNMGPDSLGRSGSNQEASLVVDTSKVPPVITLVFRGMNPTLKGTPDAWRADGGNLFSRMLDVVAHYFLKLETGNPLPEWYTHLRAANDYFLGRPMAAYKQQADIFWEGAGPDITRIINEVREQYPGTEPTVIVAGHSYGVDAATRMVPKIAAAVPQVAASLQLVGFGGIASFTEREQREIMALLGNDETRAIQYVNNNDYLDKFFQFDPWKNNMVGTRRVINGVGPDGHQYGEAANVNAMLKLIEDGLDYNPKTAMDNARKLVNEYRADPDSFLSRLAEYTSSGRTGAEFMRAVMPGSSQQPALS